MNSTTTKTYELSVDELRIAAVIAMADKVREFLSAAAKDDCIQWHEVAPLHDAILAGLQWSLEVRNPAPLLTFTKTTKRSIK